MSRVLCEACENPLKHNEFEDVDGVLLCLDCIAHLSSTNWISGKKAPLPDGLTIYLACSGMMFETYGAALISRFCHPYPKFAELRSFVELRYFDGHTLNRFGSPYFLDSGAYSAMASGKPVSLEDYSAFLRKYGEQVDYYANLDAIPPNAKADRAVWAQKTLDNQRYLEAQGFKPLPVFHLNEPWSFLEKYLDEYEYICLGGLVGGGDNDRFLEEVWGKYLTDGAGRPKVKVHGFGMTTLRHLALYPWYSVDSSTWLIHSKLGIVAFPKQIDRHPGWDFSTAPTLLSLSDNSSLRQEEGRHYDNMTAPQQESVRNYLTSMGLSMLDLRGHPEQRFIANLQYWINVAKFGNLAKAFKGRSYDII